MMKGESSTDKLLDLTLTHSLTHSLTYRPFGGLQVIFIGDFFQLPPIFTKPKDFVDCKNTICSQGFAFNSCVWNNMQLEVIGDLYSLTHSVSQSLA